MSKKFDFITDENEIEKTIGSDTYQKLKKKIKEDLRLNFLLSTFEQQCFNVNNILIKKCF